MSVVWKLIWNTFWVRNKLECDMGTWFMQGYIFWHDILFPLNLISFLKATFCAFECSILKVKVLISFLDIYFLPVLFGRAKGRIFTGGFMDSCIIWTSFSSCDSYSVMAY